MTIEMFVDDKGRIVAIVEEAYDRITLLQSNIKDAEWRSKNQLLFPHFNFEEIEEAFNNASINENCVNDTRSPSVWMKKCQSEGSQFCAFSEDGYYHGLSVCEDCPYVNK